MKKNNKVNKIIILSVIVLILTVSLVIFILNYSKDDSSFSILEKSWIKNNSNNVIDVSIYNDVPIYGIHGEGIAFSYLDEFTKTYGIEFNKVSYLTSGNNNLKNVSFRILDFNAKLSDDDILIYKDTYVIASKENTNINNISDLENVKIGVLDNDITNVRYYLNDNNKVTFITEESVESLFDKIEKKELDYIILPKTLYLDDIYINNLYISYYISELYKNYVMTVKGDNTLRNILKKYWIIYNNDFREKEYKKIYLNTVFKYKEISEEERMGYNSNPYVYGYVANMPFENVVNKEYVGIISNYLSGFEKIADVDFKIVGYNSIKELKKALSNGEIDVVFSNYNLTGLNIDTLNTTSFYSEEYYVVSKNHYIVNSIRSLKNEELWVVNNTYLYDYLNNNGIKVRGFDNTDDLLRNVNDNSIVVIDKSTYEYYKDNKFKKYNIIYNNKLDNDYFFVIRDVKKNRTFYELFNAYVSDIEYNSLNYSYNTNYIVSSKIQFNSMIKYLVIIIILVLLLLWILYRVSNKKSKKETFKKEDKLKFTDVMTSLKNRNYLNYNIKAWDENVIYPQSIVIIDLNNIKYINDNYGHEEGDNVIKRAADILINNQIENTDIMRTDGNEFLIYMVGYNEEKVQEYIRKLSRELKELPHDFGASLGYSMILDDIKTIDDAINEATLAMRTAKEKI